MAASDVSSLRRFAHLDAQTSSTLFHLPPQSLRASTDVRDVGAALGAVLYCPATSPHAGERLLNGYWPGVTAMVFCLEDAIADRDVTIGEGRVRQLLALVRSRVEHAGTRDHVPLVFVRVRTPEHLEGLLQRWGRLADELDGFVLPKIGAVSAAEHLRIIASAQRGRDRPLWALPIVEGPDIALRESRLQALLQLRETLVTYRQLVPSVRVGATDLSGIWGLRRSRDFTIYDIAVVRDIIADLVNVLGRDPAGPAISGPVWEYVREDPVFKPRLRQTPFTEEFGAQLGTELRRDLVASAIDGLLRETLLDRANGLHGKTVIHPHHAGAVDAAHAVSHEEWISAQAVAEAVQAGDGVSVAGGGPRMNEPKPHALWAQRTIGRAHAFGVLHAEHSFFALLQDSRARR
ncbi:MAG: HpcH/HpaI aldolase/citrate lyase family protein [Solirubrobacteraceae bacterium]